MTNSTPPTRYILPQEVKKCGDIIVMGARAYTMSKPENAVRWIRRDGDLVLQQCWTVTGQDENGWNQVYQEWRDVPIEPNP